MISLVVPVYNEESLLQELFSRLIKSLSAINEDFEVICVDDGSSDRSSEILLDLHQQDKRFKVLVLSRNFGHQAAFTAGLNYAKGDYVAMMDGDLQDPPELIPDMYSRLKSGEADIVYGKRKNLAVSAWKKPLIKGFHKIFKNISGFVESDNSGNFSMFSRNALDALLSLKEKRRYLPGLRSYVGYRQDYVLYERNKRPGGKSKMNLRKLFILGFDAIFSFSRLPIKICLYLGIFGIIVFLLAGIYSIIAKIFGFSLFGWSSTVLSIYFLGSIQLTFLGVLGEYIYRIFAESKNRPTYFVREYHEK
jgi:dolichol-phosphate mannosyltransferase